MKTLIRNATVVLPDEILNTHVLLGDGQILAVDAAAHSSADTTVDATGLHLLPGVIDDQVHFRDPGLEHKEDLRTGSRACAKGGITTFFEMPNTQPNTITCDRLDEKLARAAERCVVNYAFFIGATPDNLEELKRTTRTPGIKIFMGSSTGNLLVDDQDALERIFAETTLPITAHCEDETTVRANAERYADVHDVAIHSQIRDHRAAEVATRRAIDLATRHRHPFHVLHVSTAKEVELLRNSPDWVTAEACPHHLFFNVDDYARLGSRIQMNPSVKTAHDNDVLWQALHEGTIDIIATDHAPHTLEEKQQPYPQSPSGMPAVENSLALLLDQVNQQRCTLREVVNWMCERPAVIWHLQNKGRIQVGYDADVVLVDLAKSLQVRDEDQVTKCRWSAWHGTTLQGWPVRTWVRGQEVFRDGKVTQEPLGTEAIFDRSSGHDSV